MFTPLKIKASDDDILVKRYVNSNKVEVLNNVYLSKKNSELNVVKPASPPNAISPFSIIGSDNRELVLNNRAYPNICTAKIITTWPTGKTSHETAFIVGRDKAFTAGHMIYNAGEDGYASSIRMWPGRSTDAIGNIDSPYGFVDVTYYITYNGWTESHDWDYDCGVLSLSETIGDRTGTLGLRASPNTSTS